MEEPNKSEEELEEKEKSNSSAEEKQEETKEEETKEEESKEETKKEETKKEEPEKQTPTIPLSDYTRTKDVLHRVADKILADEDKLAELAEEDPKLLARLQAEFPKKFKGVKVPVKQMSDEDIDAKIEAAVQKKLKTSGKTDALNALRSELGMTEMEFLDIKADLSEKADHYLDIEFATNEKEAVMLAYRSLDPKKYEEIVQKKVAKDLATRKENSKGGAGSAGENKKFSKKILDNYKKLGFSSPEEMVKYQQKDKPIDISEHIKSKA